MAKLLLWHVAFVFAGKPYACRAEAIVYASDAEAVRHIVGHKYNILHYETIHTLPADTFILTSPEERCPN